MELPMLSTRIVSLLAIFVIAPAAAAQTPHPRAQILAAQFTKHKEATKRKNNVTTRKYKEVVSEVWLASAPQYAGRYVSDDAASIDIVIDREGRVSGTGQDERRFQLRDVAMRGGLLSGTKVYPDGSTDRFEAVLLKRSDRSAPNDEFTVTYGIGYSVDGRNFGVDSLHAFARRQ
jgi:hypothetical protein